MCGENFNLLSAELTCGKTEMVLVLPVTSFPNVNLTELQLNSPTCPISYNSTYLTASISLDGCGTKTVVTLQIEALFVFIHIRSIVPESLLRGQLGLYWQSGKLQQQNAQNHNSRPT